MGEALVGVAADPHEVATMTNDAARSADLSVRVVTLPMTTVHETEWIPLGGRSGGAGPQTLIPPLDQVVTDINFLECWKPRTEYATLIGARPEIWMPLYSQLLMRMCKVARITSRGKRLAARSDLSRRPHSWPMEQRISPVDALLAAAELAGAAARISWAS